MNNKINLIFALGILILISAACNFSYSTANLSELKFGKDKNATGGSGVSFSPNDEIFVVTAVNNAGGKDKVKFRLLYDKVEGAAAGTIAYKIEKELEIEGSRPLWFNFSVPGGIAPGTYKAEVVLTGEDGKEFDRKSGTFNVTGSSTGSKPVSDDTKSDDHDDKDSDDKDNK